MIILSVCVYMYAYECGYVCGWACMCVPVPVEGRGWYQVLALPLVAFSFEMGALVEPGSCLLN